MLCVSGQNGQSREEESEREVGVNGLEMRWLRPRSSARAVDHLFHAPSILTRRSSH